MKTVLKVALLTVLATLFYAYVGNMVPQKITYPPEDVEVSADLTTEEMVKVGQEIVSGKGTCLACHTIGSHDAGGRFPDLGTIGADAATRKEGYSDIEYIAESLYEPNAYIVEGFNPGMITATKPPVSLSDQEVLTVIAYLQSLGGTPTVTMNTKLKWQGAAPAGAATAATATARPSNLGPQELLTTYGCVTCHSTTTPDPLVGPALYDVGSRLSSAEIYESIMDPDATIAKGFDAGLMPTTLNATQFYDKVTASELKKIVDYLSSLRGNE
jgi:mono/diheme cytochrome c family protein